MQNFDNSLVEDYWSKVDHTDVEKNFYAFPPIRSRSSKLIFNESDASRKDWCEYWTVEKYLKDSMPFENCLSICCGFGEVERILSNLQVAKKITGIDIAPGAIEQARIRAQAEKMGNIEYFVRDVNTEELPQNEYDLIWANGALHHIKDLDIVIKRIKDALKPGGMFIANEYVGPNYQQIGLRQQEIVNAIKHLLPEELARKNPVQKKYPITRTFIQKIKRFVSKKLDAYLYKLSFNDNKFFGRIYQAQGVEHFLETDPSECVNSEMIIPTIQKYFEKNEIKYYDGTIIKYALDTRFFENYDSKNQNHVKLLDLLFKIEDIMIETGELSRDHAHIICQK
jgi:SAM-dependent methyltransferase